MGLIKGGLLFFVGFLLFISLFLTGVFLTLTLSLEEDASKTITANSDGIQNFLEDEYNITNQVNKNLPQMMQTCEMGNVSEVNFTEKKSGNVLIFPCEIIEQGTDSIINYGIENYADDFAEDLAENLEENEVVENVSDYLEKDFWKGKFYFALVVSLILFGIMFFLVGFSAFLDAGIVLVLAALPLLGINKVLLIFSFGLPVEELFFSESFNVFWMMVVVAIIFVIIWLAIKAFKVGWFVGKLVPGKNFAEKSFKKKV